ncbi:hypothetical protein CWI38_1406p0010 [Hamiltosporidium tvaerminnensis]|uniref:Uncharacterized protein n=1 Tax=Hamiltosporidium tvaerminnensis TaxID=1176355 RepID=A0A4Q9LR65_9MICR|nr:hypothetical protein CWI38_1406p0010 [Hamiltosporidium tvaerminnensis]
MKTKFSVYTIFAFLTETLNASKQRNNKIIWQTNSTYQNNDDYTIDGFDYLSFAKIFLSQSELSQPPKIEILQSEPSKAWKEHAQNRCIKETSDSKVNKENSSFKDKSLHMTCSNQTEPETAFYSSTPLPAFYIAFPEKAMKEQISKPLEYKYIEQNEVNPECSLPDTCSHSVIIDNSTICSEEVDFSAQEFLALNKAIEVPMNNPIPRKVAWKCGKMLYRKIHVMMSNIPSFNLFFNRKISQKNLNDVNHESILIIKEELLSLIFTSNSTDNCNENNYYDDDLDEKNILENLKKKIQKFRIEDGLKNDLSLGIICQLTNPSASKLIQRRLFALICSHCSVNIYMDKATALVNIYRDRFCGNKRLETIFNQEAQNIRNLKDKIKSMDFSQNKHDNDIQVLKILFDLEFRISHIEKAILGNSILVMSCYAKRGYGFTYNSIIKQAEEYYEDSHLSIEYFSIFSLLFIMT